MSEIRPPRAYRLPDRAVVAGVSAGLSAHFRVPVWIVRIAFIALSFWEFSGAAAYGLVWLAMPRRPDDQPIGLVIAAKEGKRSSMRRIRWQAVVGWITCFTLGIVIAWVVSFYDTSLIGRYSFDICVLALGVGLTWAARDVNLAWPGKLTLVILGVVIAWLAAALIAAPELGERQWVDDPEVLAAISALVMMGVALLLALVCASMWLIRPLNSATSDAEIIAETRAEMAAHLHDSVLQTLAVIQKQAGDAVGVARLARVQEKELRAYLYQDRLDDESFKSAIRGIVAETEATRPTSIDVVVVGDAELTVELDAVIAAAREAIVNAAKHSGADRVDVYAEISDRQAEVFVRDRGKGFSMEDIGQDRMGLRRSVIGRMSRFGGKVAIRSTPGEGTEIQLTMPYGQEGEG